MYIAQRERKCFKVAPDKAQIQGLKIQELRTANDLCLSTYG